MEWVLGLGTLLVPLLAGIFVSGRLGWELAQATLAQEPDHPRWLDAIAPLKGRWLQLFLSTPLILFAVSVTFLVVSVPLLFLTGLLLALYAVMPLIAILAYWLIALLCVITVLIIPTRATRT